MAKHGIGWLSIGTAMTAMLGSGRARRSPAGAWHSNVRQGEGVAVWRFGNAGHGNGTAELCDALAPQS